MSAARMATSGAAAVLARLPSFISATRSLRASSLRTRTTRNGCAFMAVGPHLTSS